ncbi:MULTISPECIES: hypothetical protein [Bacteroides]|jgi:hypothetical protein|uniref:Uncharacterized protein n=2 Tax=Bacteroides TaxID=816 RepID=A0A4Q5H9R7_9BACE|nr:MULTISPECIES: hypothetical protein [Bacteroides]KAA5276210.1 hypothetical protein F2Z23_02665 [Bacteroides eggerthii]KAA5283929.1 hypothetical protein F2Z10_13750 [Bacteroides eggerthii]KAB4110807.1 hypothetical protein GAQ70_05130 [Bacteroides uniformis]KAB4111105.1 hypothetical protein GAQ72_19200 [Bacteroides uniformis]KAB4125747.1 hypothetical protein GAQ75_08165 [Bacteroides uniformis]
MKMQRRKIDIIIAIDPDVEKNGVAYLNCENKNLEISTLSFPELLDYLRYVQRCAETTQKHLVVVVEAGYMNKGNWHLNPKDTKAAAAAKGNHAGRNHETARKIVEMCKHWQMEVKEVKPLEKCWKGKDRKITHEELARFTGVMGRTNQEGRDAALLAWVYAGFSIRL